MSCQKKRLSSSINLNSSSLISGQIELFYDRGNHHEFLTQLKELARHGDLIKNTSYPFEFPNVEKPYEVYTGSNVRLRSVSLKHSFKSSTYHSSIAGISFASLLFVESVILCEKSTLQFIH